MDYNTVAAERPPGLSTAHIGTMSTATFWCGGTLMRVQRNYPKMPQQGGGKRGKIMGFSRSARRRMLRKLATTNKDDLPLFVTLTFPDEYYSDRLSKAKLNKKLKALAMRISRDMPNVAYCWRKEGQIRKSGLYVGEWFPHVHLLVWGSTRAQFMPWITVNWWEVCGCLSDAHLAAGTKTEELRSRRGVMSYVSKYMSKEADYPVSMGRLWGFHNLACVPFVRAIWSQISEHEAVQLIRYMRRYARLRSRDYKSLTLFCDAEFWWQSLDRLLYPN